MRGSNSSFPTFKIFDIYSIESRFATDNQNEHKLLTSDNDNVIAIILLIARSHAAVLEIENKPVPDFRTSLGSLTPLPPHKKNLKYIFLYNQDLLLIIKMSPSYLRLTTTM